METNTTIWSIEQSFDFYSRLLDELCARENIRTLGVISHVTALYSVFFLGGD